MKIHLYKPTTTSTVSSTSDGTYFVVICGRYFKGRCIAGEWFMDDTRMTTDKEKVTCWQCENQMELKK